MMPTGDNEHGERTPQGSLGPNPTSRRSPRAADDLTRLAHELANLLDGSMRWLAIADRNLASAETDPVEAARRQLDTVRAALERMADLVNAALRSKHLSLGSPMLGGPLGPTLGETIEHAMTVMMPRAEELGVTIEAAIDKAAYTMPSGPMYSVMLNGIVNALDAIEAALAMGSSGGLVHISSEVGEAATSGRRQVTIEISDDGIGLPTEAERVFQPNYSTKPGMRGIGLAVCASIAHELGGTIALTRRPQRAGHTRPGAILRVSYPELSRGEDTIGTEP